MSDPNPNEKPTGAWYLMPILMTWLGGIIMYFAVKDKDQKMANNGLILGIVLTVVFGIIFGILWLIGLASLADMYN